MPKKGGATRVPPRDTEHGFLALPRYRGRVARQRRVGAANISPHRSKISLSLGSKIHGHSQTEKRHEKELVPGFNFQRDFADFLQFLFASIKTSVF